MSDAIRCLSNPMSGRHGQGIRRPCFVYQLTGTAASFAEACVMRHGRTVVLLRPFVRRLLDSPVREVAHGTDLSER